MDWQRQAILDAYLRREKVAAICAEFDVWRGYPRQLARGAGHDIRPTGRPKTIRAAFEKTMVL